jgi:iron complex outermembrane receptor protein
LRGLEDATRNQGGYELRIFGTVIPKNMKHRIVGRWVAATLVLWNVSLSNASDLPDSSEALEQVTVSATRRDEPLQRVPIAVSTVSGAQLERANRTGVSALAAEIPAVNFRTQASNKDTSLFIRGVGTISTSPGVESSVSTVIDGVVYGARGQATLDLLDLERVEVLRGPQGTLFGKNASAGVVSIVTRPPSEQFSGYGDVSYYGAGDEIRVRSGISGPLSDSVRGTVTALYADYDGDVVNVFDGEHVNGYRHAGGRGKLELAASDALKITLTADYLHSNDNPPLVVTSSTLIAYPTGVVTQNPAFAAALSPVVPNAANREINSDFNTHVEDDNWGLAGQADWNLGEFTLTSISAYRGWNNTQFQDGDRLSQIYQQFPRSHDRGDLVFTQYSQELRLASPKGRFVDYVTGVYYFRGTDSEIYRRDVTRCSGSTSPSVVPGLTPCFAGSATFTSDFGEARYGAKNLNYAAFGESTIHFADNFRGILGLRWTHDDVSFDHQRVSSATATNTVPGVRPSVSNSGSADEDGVSGRAGLQFDWTETVTSYVTVSRGYKGPAYNVYFNMQDLDTPVLKPEESDAFEIGVKTSTFGNRLIANLAVFDTQYDNYQANYFDTVNGAVVTRLINAGEVSTRGAELDFSARPVRALTISGGLAYIHARIDRFNCPVGAAASCQVNGKPLPYSPDWKGNVRALYEVPVSVRAGWNLELGTDYVWQSETQYDIAQSPVAIQDAFGIWNASIGLSSQEAGWRGALIVKNITDESYAPFLSAGATYVNRSAPRDDRRYFGVALRKDF